MVAFLVTILAIALLVGIIYLLLQEPQLLAAGSAIGIGVIFATLPLIVSMTAFFGAIMFGVGAVAITYGVMSINAFRRTQELRRELAVRSMRIPERDRDYGLADEAEPVRGRPVAARYADFDEEEAPAPARATRVFRRQDRALDGERSPAPREASPRDTGRSSPRNVDPFCDDERDDLPPSRTTRERTIDRIGDELDRLDQVEAAGAGRRGTAGNRAGQTERNRSLARLARRRP